MVFPNGVYDKLKIIAWVIAPLVTFVAAVGEIWGLPHYQEIAATLAALDTFLGALLTVSSSAYRKKGNDGGDNN